MKKTILLLLSILFVNSSYCLNETCFMLDNTAKNIELEKGTQSQPRSLSLLVIRASYDTETLTISMFGYNGSVQVEVIGEGGFNYSFNVIDSVIEYVHITSLQQGTYSLIITTENGAKYTGEFEL
jgi:hypothetical protein